MINFKLLLKKLYLFILFSLIVLSFLIGNFLKKYLNKNLNNSLDAALLKKNIEIKADLIEFDDIELKINEKSKPADIDWDKVNDPF